MAKAAAAIIRVVLAVTRMLDSDFVTRLYKIYEGMLNNPAYPKPPIDLAVFKAGIDSYAASVQAALDGGKAAITLRDKQRAAVVLMYHQLGHYVEVACNGDMNTFVSSGFQAQVRAPRGPAQPVEVPVIGSVDPGSEGELLVTIKKVARAASYSVRFAPAQAVATAATPGGAPVNWTIVSVSYVRPPASIPHLTPGTAYTFQVAALGKLGLSDWSSPVTKICT